MPSRVRGVRRKSFLGWMGPLFVASGVAVLLVVELETRREVSAKIAAEEGRDLLLKRNVVVIVAHPDDAEWYVSGTAAQLSQRGARLHLFVASDGERGRDRLGTSDLAAQRRMEQQNAAAILGYHSVTFWGLPDRGVGLSPTLPSLVRQAVGDLVPDAILTFDAHKPSLPYLHPDHEGVGRAVERVWNSMGRPCALYRFHTRRPNAIVDVTSVIEKKADAILAHESQVGNYARERIKARHRNLSADVAADYIETFRSSRR